MSADFTEVMERIAAPSMHVDPAVVLKAGKNSLRRRRVAGGSAGLVIATAGLALGGAALSAPAPAPASSLAVTSSAPATAPVLPSPVSLDFTQRDVDGVTRSYVVTVRGNATLHRNEVDLYELDASGSAHLLSMLALGDGAGPPPGGGREGVGGPVWGVSPLTKGRNAAVVTLQDGTQLVAPHRRVPGTSWRVFVVNGLSAAQLRQTMSVTDQ